MLAGLYGRILTSVVCTDLTDLGRDSHMQTSCSVNKSYIKELHISKRYQLQYLSMCNKEVQGNTVSLKFIKVKIIYIYILYKLRFSLRNHFVSTKYRISHCSFFTLS